MRQTLIPTLLLYISLASPLLAMPGQLENSDYKVTLSETMPGIDAGQVTLPPNAGITVTVTDKLRSQQVFYPLKAYAITSYFFQGDTLNLIARTNLTNDPAGPRFSFMQLNLSNPTDSRQFLNLKQYSFSPDQQNLLVLVDNPLGPPGLGLISFADFPPNLEWLYNESAKTNLFKSAFAGPVSDISFSDPVGWTANSQSGAFLFSVDDGTKDAQGKPLLKDYVAGLEQSGDLWKTTVQGVNLSSYNFHQGATLTDLHCDGRKASLFFTSNNSTNPVEVDFKLPPFPPSEYDDGALK